MSENNFVSKSEFDQTISFLNSNLDRLFESQNEIKEGLLELKKIIVESNGHGKAMITMVKENDERIAKLEKREHEQIEEKLTTLKRIKGYALKVGIALLYVLITFLFAREPKLLLEAIKSAFK